MLPDPSLADTVRSTLKRLEESKLANPDDPAWVQLRRYLLMAIAELESGSKDQPHAA
jgi:hypothetical protein